MIEVYVDGVRLPPSDYKFDSSRPIGPASLRVAYPIPYGAKIEIRGVASGTKMVQVGRYFDWEYGDMGRHPEVGDFMYVGTSRVGAWQKVLFLGRDGHTASGTVPDRIMLESTKIEEGS